jgi:hypothetical protein
MRLCVLQNLKTVEYKPYPHIVIENCLPVNLHNELLDTLPSDRLDQQKAVDKHGKLTWLYKEVANENYPVSNIWKEFIDYHMSREFLEKVFNTFDKVSKDSKIKLSDIVLPNATTEDDDCNAFTDFSFVKHPPANKVSNKIPHSDNEKEIYAGLLYLKYPEDKSTGGDFCIHRQKDLVMNANREYYQPGKIIRTIPYITNNFVMFWNGRYAQHSVSAREGAEHPRWSINTIARYTAKRVFRPIYG